MMTDTQTSLRAIVQTASDSTRPLHERQRAYSLIVARFQDMAFGCAHALLGNAVSAEDAAQEAFVSGWHYLGQLRDADAFPGWFKRIVVNCCQRERERNRHSATIPLSEVVALPDTKEKTPPAWLLLSEEKAQVRRAVAHLPEIERLVVTLFYIGDYSRAEVAAFLGISPIAVKKRLASARAHLKERLLTLMQEDLHNRRPSNDDDFTRRVTGFTKLFSALVDSGSPLLATLDEIANQEENPDFRTVVTSVRQSLASGSCLSQALQPHSRFFSPRYIAIIREGEVSGELDVALSRLAQGGIV